MPDFSRLLGIASVVCAVALSGCVSSDGELVASLTPSSEEAFPLPETVTVLPVSASGYAIGTAPVAASEPSPAVAGTLNVAATTDLPTGSIAYAEESIPADVPLPTPSPQLRPALAADAEIFPPVPAAPSAAAKGDRLAKLAPELAALGEEPQRKSLARNALELAGFGKPEAPRGQVDKLIAKYAELYEVPEDLVRKVVKRESNFRPTAVNRGHYGLMQIKHATARGMGYAGSASGLLDAETNLKYAVKYLRGAWIVADGNHQRADRLYQTGYYYDAKRKGLLDETGLGRDRRRKG